MQQLKKAIGDPTLLTICSDACKGLENAVKNVFPICRAKRMLFYLMKKIVKKVGFDQIYLAVWTYREDIFYDHMATILNHQKQ